MRRVRSYYLSSPLIVLLFMQCAVISIHHLSECPAFIRLKCDLLSPWPPWPLSSAGSHSRMWREGRTPCFWSHRIVKSWGNHWCHDLTYLYKILWRHWRRVTVLRWDGCGKIPTRLKARSRKYLKTMTFPYRVTHLLSKNLPLTWIWDVTPSCLGSRHQH